MKSSFKCRDSYGQTSNKGDSSFTEPSKVSGSVWQSSIDLAAVVQKVDKAIHWVVIYPVGSAIHWNNCGLVEVLNITWSHNLILT